jgi:acetylglutamate kinase
MDGNGRVLNNLDQRRANILRQSGVIRGGMIPKLEACLIALEKVPQAEIIDGTQPGALLNCIQGKSTGTRIVRNF